MTSEQLLSRANRFAGSRYGTTMTRSALLDWVDRGIVPGPSARARGRGLGKGQVWGWRSYRRVLQICRLRASGVRRGTEQVVILWLGGADYPYPVVHPALCEEYERARKRATRRLVAVRDPEGVRNSQAGSGLGFLRAAGMEPFPDLLVSAGVTDRQALDMTLAMTHGDGTGVRPTNIVDILHTVLGGDSSELVQAMPGSMLVSTLREVTGFFGILGDPEEVTHSGADTIRSADEETLMNVRRIAAVFPFAARLLMMAMAKTCCQVPETTLRFVTDALAQTGTASTRAVLFLIFLRQAELDGDRGRRLRGLADAVLMPTVRMLVFLRDSEVVRTLVQEALGDVWDGQPLTALFALALAEAMPRHRAWARQMTRALRHHGLSEFIRGTREARRARQ